MDIFDFEECPFLISQRDFVFCHSQEILHFFKNPFYCLDFKSAKHMWFDCCKMANEIHFFRKSDFGHFGGITWTKMSNGHF